MDVVELSLPSSLSSWPSSTARITFRSPGAPGTDTHTSSGTADTTSYCLRSADVVPKDLFQRCLPAPFRGRRRQQPELRVVGAVERAAPTRVPGDRLLEHLVLRLGLDLGAAAPAPGVGLG